MSILIKACFLSLCLVLFLIAQVTPAQEPLLALSENQPNRQSALENESNARELSKIWKSDAVHRALKLYLEAALQWEQIGARDKSAASLREASRLELLLGNTQSTFPLLERALQLEDNNEDLSGKIETLSLLSYITLQLGQIKNSERLYQQALALSEKTESSIAKATVYACGAELFYYQRDLKKSIENYQKAIQYWQTAGNKSGEAQTTVALAYAYMAKSDAITGLNIAQKALSIWQELGNQRGIATTFTAIGHMYTTIDEKQLALSAYKTAEGLFPDNLDRLERGFLSNGMGSIYESYGYWEQSLAYRKKALDLYQRENYTDGQIITLSSLGRLSYSNKDYTSAIQYLKRAQNLARKFNVEFHLSVVLIEFGNLYFTNGDDQKALDHYQKALKLLQRINYKRDIARVYEKLGRIYEKQGNIEPARKYYLLALKINRAIKTQFSEAESLFNLSRLDAAQDKLASALNLIEESLKLTDSLRGKVSNNKLRTTYIAEVHGRYEFYIDLLMQLHERFPNQGYDVRALQASERARARTLLDALHLTAGNLASDADPALIQREKEIRIQLNLKSDELINLLNGTLSDEEVAQVNQEIERLTAEYDEIKNQLGTGSSRYASLDNSDAFDLARFQREILDDQTVLLEFSLGEKRSFLWVVGKNEVASIVLPPQAYLNECIQRLYRLLTDREIREGEDLDDYRLRINRSEAEYSQEAQQLSEILLGSISDRLNAKRLLIVPDKQLYYLPFSALPSPPSLTEEAQPVPLIINHEIVYEPSASSLLLLKNNVRQNVSNKTLLVFADPVFSKQDSRLTGNELSDDLGKKTATDLMNWFSPTRSAGDSLPRLPATKKEAETIAGFIHPDEATVLTGTAAKREHLFDLDISNYRIVHFATHGQFNEKNPEYSGLVLSLFDEQGQPQNGYLRVADIYSLNLPLDLAVLSACRSGMGKEMRGEGIMGLTRGFMQAGTKSVLSSLWKVDDAATAEMMTYFYQALLSENLPPAQALRRAQIKMSQNPQWHSPFYWAAFNLHGEFRQSISPAKKTIDFIYFWWIAVIAFGIGLIYLVRKRILG